MLLLDAMEQEFFSSFVIQPDRIQHAQKKEGVQLAKAREQMDMEDMPLTAESDIKLVDITAM